MPSTAIRSHSNDITANCVNSTGPALTHSHSQRSAFGWGRRVGSNVSGAMSGRLSAAGQMSFRRLSNNAQRKPVTSGRTHIFAGTFRAKFSQDQQSDDGTTPLITKLDKYSPEELKEYRQVFNMFDTDRSGAIGLDELENAITNLGMDPKQVDLEMLIKEADKRGNHQIDFDEFCEVMKTMSEKTQSWNEIIKECFTVFDRSENGLISKRDFEFVLRELGHITNSELLDELFLEYDVDSDGFIDFDEFSFLVKNYLTDDDVF
uniref:Calmodulin n=1 Tax=Bursaphelenchus xylophilus TaxID=6326 RepID=A0A1I7RS60_BURXY